MDSIATNLIDDFLQGKEPSTLQNYHTINDLAAHNPEAFWGYIGRAKITWETPFDTAYSVAPLPNGKWFEGGKLNLSVNCLDRWVEAGRGDACAMVSVDELGQEERYTYAELLGYVCHIAASLRAHGVGINDRVVIYAPSDINTAAVMLACARIGAVHCVVFAGFSQEALLARIQDVQPKLVYTAETLLRKGKYIPLRERVLWAVHALDGENKPIVFTKFNHKKDQAEYQTPLAPLSADEYDLEKEVSIADLNLGGPEWLPSSHTAFLLPTSGSTGKPKCIQHALGGYTVHAATTFGVSFGPQMDDVYWCTADLGWITGHTYGVYAPLLHGITTLLADGSPTLPHAGRWYEILENYGVNIWYTSPTVLKMLRLLWDDLVHGYNLLALRVLGAVGEPLNAEIRDWYEQIIGQNRCVVVDTWWQTETGGHLVVSFPHMPLPADTTGLPFPGIGAQVVNASTKKPCAIGGLGSLILTGDWPGRFVGCFNQEGRYQGYFAQYPWAYETGDQARINADGYVRIEGRSDDVVNVSGHRIGTQEAEGVLLQIPSIGEVAIIGKPHPIKGECLKACIVLRSGIRADTQTILAEANQALRQHIGSFALLDEVEFLESLPKTRSGKIVRRALRARERGEDMGDTSTLE